MIRRLAVSSKVGDAHARQYLQTLRAVFPKTGLANVATVALYTIDANITPKELEKAATRLANPLTEYFSIKDIPHPRDFTFAIEIGYLPGVTDNLGRTARETIEDCTGRKFKEGENVYSSYALFLDGDLSKSEVESFSRELHNPLIERATVFAKGTSIPVVAPRVRLHGKTNVSDVDLDVSDAALAKISSAGITNADGTRRGPLGPSQKQMKVIREYFSAQ